MESDFFSYECIVYGLNLGDFVRRVAKGRKLDGGRKLFEETPPGLAVKIHRLTTLTVFNHQKNRSWIRGRDKVNLPGGAWGKGERGEDAELTFVR